MSRAADNIFARAYVGGNVSGAGSYLLRGREKPAGSEPPTAALPEVIRLTGGVEAVTPAGAPARPNGRGRKR